MAYINDHGPLPTSTKTFRNGRSTAVRIPAEFGIRPGEELVVSQDSDGTVRLARAAPFAGYLAAVERMRAEGHDPSKSPFKVPRMGAPRAVDVGPPPTAKVGKRRKSR